VQGVIAVAEAQQRTLNHLDVRRRAVVKSILDGPWCQRLLDMGLVPDTMVEVIRRSPMAGPVVYQVRGFCIALRASEAKKILIEEVK
jgi:ferrous iron transport protein A